MFDSRIWDVLDADDVADREGIEQRMTMLSGLLRREPQPEEEIQVVIAEIGELQQRMAQRINALFALHITRRNLLIAHPEYANLDDAALLATFPPGDGVETRLCPHGRGTVWPTDIIPPPPSCSNNKLLILSVDAPEAYACCTLPDYETPKSKEAGQRLLGINPHDPGELAEYRASLQAPMTATGELKSKKEL